LLQFSLCFGIVFYLGLPLANIVGFLGNKLKITLTKCVAHCLSITLVNISEQYGGAHVVVH
jgi:hypothetical protein